MMRRQTLSPIGQARTGVSWEGRRGCALLVLGTVVLALVPAAAGAAGGVPVSPGDSIQALVDANPAGTAFLIKAGVHQSQQVIPKTGDSFVGEEGAILDGGGTLGYAFTGSAGSVTLRNLIIQHYAPGSQQAVIQGGGVNWLIEDCEIRDSRSGAIRASSGWLVRNNYIHHLGAIGVGGQGDNITYEGNEIAFNNTENVDPSWEGGGAKFVHTTNLVVRGNYVHDNKGPGLWTDYDNLHTLYEGNRVINNYGPGIFHEISYDAVIRNNLVEGNGFGAPGWVDGAGILVGDSANVEIYGNTVRNNNDGIGAKHTGRGSAFELKNLSVHNNVIVMAGGLTGVVRMGGLTDPVWSAEWNNRFDYNTYTLDSPTADRFAWAAGYINQSEWLTAGQATHSTWTNTNTPTPPTTTTTTTTITTREVMDLVAGALGPALEIVWRAIGPTG